MMDGIREKLHHSKLHDIKVDLIHTKHKIGKFGNIVSV